jgi:hypothetical protein
VQILAGSCWRHWVSEGSILQGVALGSRHCLAAATTNSHTVMHVTVAMARSHIMLRRTK